MTTARLPRTIAPLCACRRRRLRFEAAFGPKTQGISVITLPKRVQTSLRHAPSTRNSTTRATAGRNRQKDNPQRENHTTRPNALFNIGSYYGRRTVPDFGKVPVQSRAAAEPVEAARGVAGIEPTTSPKEEREEKESPFPRELWGAKTEYFNAESCEKHSTQSYSFKTLVFEQPSTPRAMPLHARHLWRNRILFWRVAARGAAS